MSVHLILSGLIIFFAISDFEAIPEIYEVHFIDGMFAGAIRSEEESIGFSILQVGGNDFNHAQNGDDYEHARQSPDECAGNHTKNRYHGIDLYCTSGDIRGEYVVFDELYDDEKDHYTKWINGWWHHQEWKDQRHQATEQSAEVRNKVEQGGNDAQYQGIFYPDDIQTRGVQDAEDEYHDKNATHVFLGDISDLAQNFYRGQFVFFGYNLQNKICDLGPVIQEKKNINRHESRFHQGTRGGRKNIVHKITAAVE